MTLLRLQLAGLVFLLGLPVSAVRAEEAVEPNSGKMMDDRVGGLNSEQMAQLALAEASKEAERVWLKVEYPEDGVTHDVLALEQRPRTAQAQGGVLILHDREQHADWPHLIRTLRLELPEFGWYTLSVNLPYEQVRKVPKRELAPKQYEEIVLNAGLKDALNQPQPSRLGETSTSGDTRAGEINKAGAEAESVEGESSEAGAASADPNPDGPESAENVDIDLADRQAGQKRTLSYAQRAQYHLKAAMKHLQSKGYQNIAVIGYRAGADVALDYIKPIASGLPKQGFALVMIDPQLTYAYQTDLQQALGKRFQAPVLDIVNAADLDARALASEREAGARIADVRLYRQIQLVTNEGPPFQQSLLRRIRAWLDKYAPGMSAQRLSRP